MFGYTNASWTLKADLTSEYVCRLLNHMTAHRRTVTVDAKCRLPAGWRSSPGSTSPRAMCSARSASFPKQGSEAPWKLHQNYALDMVALRFGKLEDGALRFSKSGGAAAEAALAAAA